MSGFFASLDGVQAVAAGALVAGLWQGVLLSAAAGACLRLTPRSTAALRFMVWTAVFCASVALPFWNLAGSGVAAGTPGSHLRFDERWSYVLAGVWLVASGYRLVGLVLQGVALQKLWSGAAPVLGKRLDALEAPLVVRGRRVELCTSDEVDRPSVIGFLAPKILVPSWLLEELTAMELDHIVLHELEHLRRRDDWMNLLQKVGLVVLPLNPALFWIDRRLSTERELACDDRVLERTKNPRAYAASLASVAERQLVMRSSRRIGILALAATGLKRRSELAERIESILRNRVGKGMRAPVKRGVAATAAALLVAGILGSTAELARAPRLVTFGSGGIASQAAVRPVRIEPRNAAAPVATSSQVGAVSGYRNVSFQEPVKQRVAGARAASIRLRVAKARLVRDESVSEGDVVLPTREVAGPSTRQYVVLTSFEEGAAVTRVVVQTPDGKFAFVPYAALTTEAGWLLVQL